MTRHHSLGDETLALVRVGTQTRFIRIIQSDYLGGLGSLNVYEGAVSPGGTHAGQLIPWPSPYAGLTLDGHTGCE